MADVKMFPQINLASEDQDVHCYLWHDIKTDESPTKYKMTHLTFGVNSSPFFGDCHCPASCKEIQTEVSRGIRDSII